MKLDKNEIVFDNINMKTLLHLLIGFLSLNSYSMEEEKVFNREEQLRQFRKKANAAIPKNEKVKLLSQGKMIYTCGLQSDKKSDKNFNFILEDKQVLGRKTNIRAIKSFNDKLEPQTLKRISRYEIEVLLDQNGAYHLSFVGRNRKKDEKGTTILVGNGNTIFDYGGHKFQCFELKNVKKIMQYFNVPKCEMDPSAKSNKRNSSAGHDDVAVGSDFVYKAIDPNKLRSALVEIQNYEKFELLKTKYPDLNDFIPQYHGLCTYGQNADSKIYYKIAASAGSNIDIKLGKKTASRSFLKDQLHKKPISRELKMQMHGYIDHTSSSATKFARVEGITGLNQEVYSLSKKDLQKSLTNSLQIFANTIKAPRGDEKTNKNFLLDCIVKIEKLNSLLETIFNDENSNQSAKFIGASLLISQDSSQPEFSGICNVKLIDFANSTIIIGENNSDAKKRTEHNNSQISQGMSNVKTILEKLEIPGPAEAKCPIPTKPRSFLSRISSRVLNLSPSKRTQFKNQRF